MTSTPIRRNLRFSVADDDVRHWHRDGIPTTQFFNTLSIFFPEGERFFIKSVRHYRDRITCEVLAEAVDAFVAQEALHGREHREYNRAQQAQGIPAEALERFVLWELKLVQRHLPPTFQLAATVALEHLTACLGHSLLSNPQVLEGASARYAALWRWHALEEIEHKSVAFDVYREVMGQGLGAWLLRGLAMAVASAIFWPELVVSHVHHTRSSGGLWDVRGWLKLAATLWGRPGVLRKLIPEYLRYYGPRFHPWDKDDRHLIAPHLEQVQSALAAAA